MTPAAALALAIQALEGRRRTYASGRAAFEHQKPENGAPLPFAVTAAKLWTRYTEAIEMLQAIRERELAEGQ